MDVCQEGIVMMEQYIDIHSHILPGIDDGAKNEEISVRMLRAAVEDGISHIILTPHNKPGRHMPGYDALNEKAGKLQAALAKEGITINLYIGSELYYRSGLVQELENGSAQTLAASRYVLVEFGIMEEFDYIRNGIYTLLSGGYSPILAHVERYRNVCAKKTGAADLAEMGAYLQLNAGSIMGKFGWNTRQYTRNLLKKHLVHFIATDAHDMEKRAPYLAACADYVGKKFGEDYRRKLFYENPADILRQE